MDEAPTQPAPPTPPAQPVDAEPNVEPFQAVTGSLTDSQPASKLAHRLDAAPAIPTPDPHSAGEAPPTLPTPHATHAMQGAASGLAPRPPPPPTSPPPRTSVRPPPEPPAQGGHAGLSGPTEPVAARASQAQAASGERPHKGTTRTDDLANGRADDKAAVAAQRLDAKHAREAEAASSASMLPTRDAPTSTPQPPQPDAAPRSQPPAGDQVHPAQVHAPPIDTDSSHAPQLVDVPPQPVRIAVQSYDGSWAAPARPVAVADPLAVADALAATLAAPRSEGPETASQIWSPRTASLEPALKPALEPRAETSPSRHAGSTCEGESHTQTHSGSAPPLGVRDPGHGGSSGRTGVFNHGQALLVLIEYLKRLRRSKGAAAAGGAPGTDGNDDDDSGASRGRLVMGKLSPASLTSCSS